MDTWGTISATGQPDNNQVAPLWASCCPRRLLIGSSPLCSIAAGATHQYVDCPVSNRLSFQQWRATCNTYLEATSGRIAWRGPCRRRRSQTCWACTGRTSAPSSGETRTSACAQWSVWQNGLGCNPSSCCSPQHLHQDLPLPWRVERGGGRGARRTSDSSCVLPRRMSGAVVSDVNDDAWPSPRRQVLLTIGRPISSFRLRFPKRVITRRAGVRATESAGHPDPGAWRSLVEMRRPSGGPNPLRPSQTDVLGRGHAATTGSSQAGSSGTP